MEIIKCTRCKVFREKELFIGRGNSQTKVCKVCRDTRKAYTDLVSKGLKTPKGILAEKREEALKKGNFICSKCKVEKPLNEFKTGTPSTKNFNPLGYSYSCNSCLKLVTKFSKVRRYGIDKDFLLQLYEQQDKKCAICKIPLIFSIEEGNRNDLICIDHDHDTQKVRGLLCSNCNRGLGLFKDNDNILLSAYNYLLAHNKQGELLENPEKGNQQPSLDSNILEGSETNSQILPSNVEDSNADTSALPFIVDSNSITQFIYREHYGRIDWIPIKGVDY